MTDTPATPPASPAEAASRLETRMADPAWRDAYLSGNGPEVAESRSLHEMIASGDDPVASAMTGAMPDLPSSEHRLMSQTADVLRDHGIREEVIRETLEARPASDQDRAIALAWKNQHMRDEGWVKRYMTGDSDARREMTLANIILSSPQPEKA